MRKYAGKYTNGLDESDDTNTDWQDLLYKNSIVTNHDVGLAGGSATGAYNVGVSIYRDESLPRSRIITVILCDSLWIKRSVNTWKVGL